jgi:hypothetical protein
MVWIGSDGTHLFWGAQGVTWYLVGALQRARDLPRSVAASVHGRLQPTAHRSGCQRLSARANRDRELRR